jgi:hypothetical protein
VEIFLVIVAKLSKTNLLVEQKSAVKLFPFIELNSLASVSLKNFDTSVRKFDDHTNMIVFTVCHQPLQRTFRVVCLHQKDIP